MTAVKPVWHGCPAIGALHDTRIMVRSGNRSRSVTYHVHSDMDVVVALREAAVNVVVRQVPNSEVTP